VLARVTSTSGPYHDISRIGNWQYDVSDCLSVPRSGGSTRFYPRSWSRRSVRLSGRPGLLGAKVRFHVWRRSQRHEGSASSPGERQQPGPQKLFLQHRALLSPLFAQVDHASEGEHGEAGLEHGQAEVGSAEVLVKVRLPDQREEDGRDGAHDGAQQSGQVW